MFTLYIHVDTLTVTEKVKMLSYRRDRAVGCIVTDSDLQASSVVQSDVDSICQIC